MPHPLPVLKRHRLSHIPELQVGPRIDECTFAASCSMQACRGACCNSGVYADLKERDAILANVEVIHRAMDPDQEHDPNKWFDPEERVDPDFPSGRAIGTQANARGCIFLNSQMRCVLQKAEMELEAPPLKPFYCWAYPVTVDAGVLTVDVENSDGHHECCAPVAGGRETQKITDFCGWELEYVLGKEGLAELRGLAKK